MLRFWELVYRQLTNGGIGRGDEESFKEELWQGRRKEARKDEDYDEEVEEGIEEELDQDDYLLRENWHNPQFSVSTGRTSIQVFDKLTEYS